MASSGKFRDGPAHPKRQTRGPGAAAFKYDILTALMVTAAHSSDGQGRLAGRLALLVTARFNWQTETFAVGQRELARLWNVTERTVKREMAAMRALGWLRVVSPAVRGRVARYGIDLDCVLRATARHWDAVGPDFTARMAGIAQDTDAAGLETNVVPLRPSGSASGASDPWGWHMAARTLQASQPALFDAWFAGLVPTALEGGRLHLTAPSRFVAEYVSTHYRFVLLGALSGETAEIRDVVIIPAG